MLILLNHSKEEIENYQKVINKARHEATTEAVIWLLQNCDNYQPEYLASNMSYDLLKTTKEGEEQGLN